MAKTFQYTMVERTDTLHRGGVFCFNVEGLMAEVQALQRAGWEIVSTGMESRAQGPPWQSSHTLRVTYYFKRPEEEIPYRTASTKR